MGNHYDDARDYYDDKLNAEHKQRTGLTYDEWQEWQALKKQIREYEDFMAIEKKRTREEELRTKFFTKKI